MLGVWSRPARLGGAAAVTAVRLVLVGLLVLVLVEPGLGIYCYSCVTYNCYIDTEKPPCNTYKLPVCNWDGKKGNLVHCGNFSSFCKEETFSDAAHDVYRNCGDDWSDNTSGVHCDDEGFCTCDTDGCNIGLAAAPRAGGMLWWGLMAVPAVAAVLLTVAFVLRLRHRRRAAQAAQQRPDSASGAEWDDRPPGSPEHRLL